MLDNILSLVKDQVSGIIDKNNEIPADEKAKVVDTTTSTLMDGFISNFTENNLSSLSGLFGGGGGGGDLVETLKNSVVSVLSEKIGLSKEVANNIAASVVPTVTNLLSSKVNDSNEPGFTLESVIGAFSGKTGGKSGGGIVDTLKGFFGGK